MIVKIDDVYINNTEAVKIQLFPDEIASLLKILSEHHSVSLTKDEENDIVGVKNQLTQALTTTPYYTDNKGNLYVRENV